MAVMVLVGTSGCASGEQAAETPPPTPTAATATEECEIGARRIVERLERLIEDLGPLTFEEFLASEEIDGLSDFQNDVAGEITEFANENSTLCNLDGLQQLVDGELAAIDDSDLLTSYLVSLVRSGGPTERSDVLLGPDADFAAILPRLADGSTIELEAGEYAFDSTLLIQRSLVLVGAGIDETTVVSTASDAALAVFGEGALVLRDLTIAHEGDLAASVVLALGASVDIERVRLQGALGDEEAGGGSGILLSDGVVGEDGQAAERTADAPATPESRIVDSEIVDNGVAGITVTGALTPEIRGNAVAGSGSCGMCFVGQAGGQVEDNDLSDNEFGIQVGDEATPNIAVNRIHSNSTAGIVVLGSSAPVVTDNLFEDNGEVGIAVQEQAAPVLGANEVAGSHTIGLTIIDAATPKVTGASIAGIEVALQVAGTAAPRIDTTTFSSDTVGVVYRAMAAGEFHDNVVNDAEGVGLLIEGEAKPMIERLTVSGSEVDVSYREQAGGVLADSTFEGSNIAVQVEDEAAPRLIGNRVIEPAAAAFVVRSSGATEIVDNTIERAVGLAIGLAGETIAVVTANVIEGGETAISAVEDAAGSVDDNVMIGQQVAVQLAEQASTSMRGNRIVDASTVAIVVRDDATSELIANTIVNPTEIGLQVVGDAKPFIAGNVLVSELDINAAVEGGADSAVTSDQPDARGEDASDDPEGVGTSSQGVEADEAGDVAVGEQATVGILFAESGAGQVEQNEVIGFVIGVQIGDTAAPTLEGNVVDGGRTLGVGFLYRGEASGVAVDNEAIAHSVGFQIGDNAKPSLTGNVVSQVSDVAFLVQGGAVPEISGNACPAGLPGIGVIDGAAPIIGENNCLAVNGG